MHDFDAGQDDADATKILGAQLWWGDPFEGPVVLFNHAIQVPDLTDRGGRLPLGVHRVQCSQIRAAFVDGYRLGYTVLSDRLFTRC